MKILIVAATELEVQPLLKKLLKSEEQNFSYNGHEIGLLITGVGLTATAFALGKALQKPYDLAINMGLAGSFNRDIALGEVVNVIQDCMPEEGAEEGEKLLSLSELGLRKEDDFPFKNDQLEANYPAEFDQYLNYKKLRGISVNKVHGTEESISKILALTSAEVESMEGAAFFYSCLLENVPALQVRAISNYVEKRNKEAWEIEIALNNLADAIHRFLADLK